MMKPRVISVLLSLGIVLACIGLPSRLSAQGVDYLKANYIKYEHQIPMRDGKKLFTAVYVPKDTAQKYPLLLWRTQSGLRPYGTDQFPRDLGPSPLFAKAGYIFVMQDVRGRWMSEGDFVNVRPHNPAKKVPADIDESSDAYDTIDWLLKQVPNHNGRVGLWGSSYRGFYAAAGTIDAHPAVKAVTPQAPIVDWFMGDDWHHNGALLLNHAFNYLHTVSRPRPAPFMKPPAPFFEHTTTDGYQFFLKLGPLSNANARYFRNELPFWNDLMRHGTYDEFWRARNLRPHLKKIRPAVMAVGGWFDAENLFGPLETYRTIEASSPGITNVLVMGPWIHGGWIGGQGAGESLGDVNFGSKTVDFYREQIELPFFEFHLKDQGELKHPEAWVFETGANQWRRHDAWPPRAVQPQAWYLREDGGLRREAPVAANADLGRDEYVSDPARPVPFQERIAISMSPDYMSADQRFAARRPDVLVYESPVLEQELTVAGPIPVELHVATTGTDADWIVKLIDVYPEDHPDPNPNPKGVRLGGYQQLVRGEVLRGKFRNSFEKPEAFAPNRPTLVRFSLPDVYHTFRRGHRLMVQVQSSWFPLIDRNPQTFVDIYSASAADFRKATQRVFRTKELASRIVLPVLR
jgi:putative CocE/NonD family hydrolase